MGGILSIIDHGNKGILATIECSLSNSLPNIVVVGFAHRSVDEAKERIRAAMSNSSIPIPKKRIIVNLSPADIPKQGSSFDLPMLIAIICSSGVVTNSPDKNTVVLGEVGLDGKIRPIRGIIGKILSAKKHGISNFWIPQENVAQASLIPDIKVYGFSTVSELYCSLTGLSPLRPNEIKPELKMLRSKYSNLIDEVAGQEQVKRALVIAAAGHHNVLINGPPGTGKTMLARSVIGIMPELTTKEMLDVTHINSLAGKEFEKIITERPFRDPHHSSSASSILGGGNSPHPGEISLGHHGVLFLDEFPEFQSGVLESLRQPLEDKKISIARLRETVEYPADFMLIATSNPCPCGFNSSYKQCLCSPVQVVSYQKKISGPIADRIDLFVESETIEYEKILTSHNKSSRVDILKAKVSAARDLQYTRSGKLNDSLSNSELKKYAKLQAEPRKLLDESAFRMSLSARGYIRTLRVARTIADIEASANITSGHIIEALQFRQRQPG